jgi:rubredoxin
MSHHNPIKFVCPECGGTDLESVLDGTHSCLVTKIDVNGQHEYGPFESQGNLLRWQCADCGFMIVDEGPILEPEDLADWCLAHCPQN